MVEEMTLDKAPREEVGVDEVQQVGYPLAEMAPQGQ
jgi:hypothetical protein